MNEEYDQMRELMKIPWVADLAKRLQALKTACFDAGLDWEKIKDRLDADMKTRPALSVMDSIDFLTEQIKEGGHAGS